jgi:hypothetical protein
MLLAAGLLLVGGMGLVFMGVNSFRYVDATVIGLGGGISLLGTVTCFYFLQMGNVVVNRKEINVFGFFGNLLFTINKGVGLEYSIRESASDVGTVKELITSSGGKLRTVSLFGMSDNAFHLRQFFGEKHHDSKLNRVGLRSDFRSFGWMLLVMGLFLTAMLLLSLTGSKRLADSRFEIENIASFEIQIDDFNVHKSKAGSWAGLSLLDDSSAPFEFEMPTSFFSVEELEKIARTASLVPPKAIIWVNQELYEEKVLGLDRTLNFNEKHFSYEVIKVFKCEIAGREYGDLSALSKASGNKGLQWGAVFMAFLAGLGFLLIRSNGEK